MPFDAILFDVEDQVATVTLNRPAKLNAWTPVMGAELIDVFRQIDRDPEIRVAVLTGAGDRAFCAGADVGFFSEQIAAGGGMDTRKSTGTGPNQIPVFPTLMHNFTKPLIAAINGYALGVGATMPLLCDVRIAAEEAKIGFIFSRMGVMAELGSTYLLPRIVGTARACELMLSGETFTAAECQRMGLVNRVVSRARLREAVLDLANEMKRCAPLSLMLTRQALHQSFDGTLETQLRFEAYALEYLYRTDDHAEAVKAFREKRPPRFRGS